MYMPSIHLRNITKPINQSSPFKLSEKLDYCITIPLEMKL